MSTTALAAVKAQLATDTFLPSIRATGETAVFYQKAPDGTDLTTGIVYVLDHRGETWERSMETRTRTLTFGIIAFGNSFQTLDSVVVPAIIDLIDDADQWLEIDGHVVNDLQIQSIRTGLEDYRDANTNNVFSADIECTLEYKFVRKSSANDNVE